MREVKEGGRGRWGIERNYPSSVVLSIPLPGLHSVVSAGAVAPSAGRVHPSSLGALQPGKPHSGGTLCHTSALCFLKNNTSDSTFQGGVLTAASADRQKLTNALSATAAGAAAKLRCL